MIQVALFALFQLVEYYDERSGGGLLIGAFLALLVVGIGLFIGAAKVKFPSIIFIVQGLVITVAFLTGAEPECRFGVVGTASLRSWYRCSTYPVLQGVFFHS